MKVHAIATDHSVLDPEEVEELVVDIDPDIVYTEGEFEFDESLLEDEDILKDIEERIERINRDYDGIRYGVENVQDFEPNISREATAGARLAERGFEVGFMGSANRKNNLVYDVLTYLLDMERQQRGTGLGDIDLPEPSLGHSNTLIPRSETHDEIDNIFQQMMHGEAESDDLVDYLRPYVWDQDEQLFGSDSERLIELALHDDEERFVQYLKDHLQRSYPNAKLEIPDFGIEVLQEALNGDSYDADPPFRGYHEMRDSNWFQYIQKTAGEEDEIAVVAGASHFVPTPYEEEEGSSDGPFTVRDWFEHEDYDVEIHKFF